ncbi:MAG TPA: AgmX/PglI C-terminal domain-containing protein [Polyangiaceae bacterium LLY-WYZ-15_(1-7)]|nr:hypothetical protein [Myxococcales bacterium]MBJ71909.1 hypothetical protein [Sandaracinus sp.]HJL03719.1 AgmX/PglI C-terminal domain-containing protein [Polyangiaceae bacterium LLY-WYZ-15_(1-7)]HJL08191.1 AgmX/PglI C-terminal domain-containing protein [Polyangiaceae bacterium LLY-WYZ-15_(1-7)]HJL20763.1 AgmX/PglI C-terminal domain-containing protein [Polyangiaceae bacterium LLY-WYZ-15_(1-7)]
MDGRRFALTLALILSACGADAPEVDPVAEGWRAARAGDHEVAAARYEEATAARPDDAEAWAGLARERLRADQPSEAVTAARRAVELADASADAHELLGRSLLAAAREVRDGEAGAEGETADGPETEGDAPDAPETEGEAAEPGPRGRAAEAAAELARALELDPARARVHFALARAHELAGEPEAAIEAYRASAEAEVLAARSLAAAARTKLDALGRGRLGEALGEALDAELERAEALASEDDDAARAAIAAQRRRLERKREAQSLRAAERVLATDREIAENAGILRALGSTFDGASPFGANAALGSDAMAGIRGVDLDGFGMGGLGLGGSGRGGGGTGEGTLGLGGLGTRGAGTGSGGGLGAGRGQRVATRVQLGSLTARGPLEGALAQRVLRRFLGSIRACYERALRASPELEGELTLNLTIDARGSVTGSTVSGSTLGLPVDDCVAGRGRRMAFPAADGTTTVSAPLSFSRAR